jgi:hypothetical protein
VDGATYPAKEAIGNSGRHYTCVRTTFDISAIAGALFTIEDKAIGEQLVGVFA